MHNTGVTNKAVSQGSICVRGFFVTVLLLLLSNCTTTRIDEYRQGETGIESHESIVILGRRQGSTYETREQFVECVGDAVSQGEFGLRVIPEIEFIDALFPWFEPRTAPLRTEDLQALMQEPIVEQKMAEYGIRYLVWVDGQTERSNSLGTLSCTIAPGGAGCFGFGTWENDSNFDVRVWDIRTFDNVGTISAEANGQSYMPALVIPIPLIARVENNACQSLAAQLQQFVRGE
ncbi:MAG: hypothetical protein R3332_06650 [Pseudohongiellaceae bacterium]|nr:hypothetical protein [Pseudohongiellaceae bacterium]